MPFDAIKEGQTAWLSRGFEELTAKADHERVFDVIIVGSGYGGAIAAAELAGRIPKNGDKPLRIAVLERGNEYLPGSFPAHWGELPKHLRLNGNSASTMGAPDGLFDIRAGEHVNALMANGLGGGSLINAGVMIEPHSDVFDGRWPTSLSNGLGDYYKQTRKLLDVAATSGEEASPSSSDQNSFAAATHKPKKVLRLERLAVAGNHPFSAAAISVSLNPSPGNRVLKACLQCGDCATGCNYGAKKSLDTNVLEQAARKGVELYTGATVLRFEKVQVGKGWELFAGYTNKRLRERQGEPVKLKARQLIIAAGSYGSTELLLRSQSNSLKFSPMLGSGFSSNGDMIAAGYPKADKPEYQVNAIADERIPPHERNVGPTITGVVELPPEGGRPRIMVQEMAAPGSLGRLFSELVTTGNLLHKLGTQDSSKHEAGKIAVDPAAVNPAHIQATSIYATFGDDGAAGKFRLADDHGDFSQEQGGITVDWPELPRHSLFDAQITALEELAPDEVIIPNPGWRLLPKEMAFLTDDARGPLLSVHPLGGCRMADDVAAGVVNEFGQVFDVTGTLHDGLMVLDGSIVPSALGANPALTIAALALRGIQAVASSFKAYSTSLPSLKKTVSSERPWFRDVQAMYRQHPEIFSPPETIGDFTERLSGPVRMVDSSGVRHSLTAEITLDFQPVELPQLYAQGGSFTLGLSEKIEGGPLSSRMRLFAEGSWQQIRDSDKTGIELEQLRDQLCLVSTELSGALHLFEREASGAFGRTLRAGSSWLRMRGVRDAVRSAIEGKVSTDDRPLAVTVAAKALGAFALASRGGEVRLMRYELALGEVLINRHDHIASKLAVGDPIRARKRISYRLFSSPWAQLAELPLELFPGMVAAADKGTLALDYQFMVDQGQALFRISKQHDQATALGELGQWGFYLLRLMLGIHVWSLRSPDKAPKRTINRLPESLPGLPLLETKRFVVDHYVDDNGDYQPASMQLSRYRGTDSSQPPVLCIHGYSASGTTFCHRSIKPNLVTELHKRGADVWVLDMRGSPDIKGSTHNWALEELALTDIPLAVDWVLRETEHSQIDIVAHCMGAAMVSMAVLSADHTSLPVPNCDDAERLPLARKEFPQRVRRIVMSQVGPVVMPTPLNRLRGYMARFLIQRLPDLKYSFRPEENPPLPMQLMDRLFAAQDYPIGEMRAENPLLPWKKVGHVGSRRRIDGLYGRTFELDQLSKSTLRHLDDLFGPTNLETIAQVRHFARWFTITGRDGFNHYVSRERMQRHWKIPTLYLHGKQNGMMDVANASRMQKLFEEADIGQWLQPPKIYPDFGHQDLFIGKNSQPVFNDIAEFLSSDEQALISTSVAAIGKETGSAQGFSVGSPWCGPRLGIVEDGDENIAVSFGLPPNLSPPSYILFLAVTLRADDELFDWATPLDSLSASDIAVRRLKTPANSADVDWLGASVPHMLFQRSNSDAVLIALIHGDSSASESASGVDSGVFSAGEPLIAVDLADFQADKQRYDQVLAALEFQRNTHPEQLARGLLKPNPAIFSKQNRSNADTIRVAFGSCQYPRGLLDQEPAAAAWKQLNQRLDSKASPELLLLLGDQIYTDASAGLFDPVNLDDRFSGPYRVLYREPEVGRALSRLPVAAMLDDHEMVDNWEPDARDPLPGLFTQLLSEPRCQSYLNEQPALRQLTAYLPIHSSVNRRLNNSERDNTLNALLNTLLQQFNDEASSGESVGHAADLASQICTLTGSSTPFWAPLKAADDSSYAMRGLQGYLKYQRTADWRLKPLPQQSYKSVFDVPLYYAFSYRGLAFFMVDSRTERQRRDADSDQRARMISEAQMQQLKQWLLETANDKPKVIASPSVFLPRHTRAHEGGKGYLHSDGWDGFPQCQAELMRFIADNAIGNVIFLSGDEHLGMNCQATLSSQQGGKLQQTTIMSLHSTALYAPYPFANAKPEDLLANECFDVEAVGASDQPLKCEVQSLFMRGQGFTELLLEPAEQAWRFSCEFFAAEGEQGSRLFWGATEGLYCAL